MGLARNVELPTLTEPFPGRLRNTSGSCTSTGTSSRRSRATISSQAVRTSSGCSRRSVVKRWISAQGSSSETSDRAALISGESIDWVDGRRTDGQSGKRTNGQTGKRANGQTANGQTGKRANGQSQLGVAAGGVKVWG